MSTPDDYQPFMSDTEIMDHYGIDADELAAHFSNGLEWFPFEGRTLVPTIWCEEYMAGRADQTGPHGMARPTAATLRKMRRADRKSVRAFKAAIKANNKGNR
jgi:hypothetical protein